MSNNENDQLSIQARRKRVIGRLWVRAAKAFQEIAVQRIRDRGHDDYRVGDNVVLIHLEDQGNRMSELAARSGVTKQAISQVVRDLERRELVERAPDPSDGRAQIVRLTARGKALMDDGIDVVFALDEELSAIVEPGEIDAMRDALIRLLDHLDPDGF